MLHTIRYGRLYDDFIPGAVMAHPWEVTLDEGMLALFAASFQDAMPTSASRRIAKGLGFRDRPVPPLLLLNFGLSFSVHDVSEQAIAHLGYMNVRFPNPCFAGDTISARSKVIGTRPVSTGDKGVIHVQTEVHNQDGAIVCAFERKVLVRAGKLAERPNSPPASDLSFAPMAEKPVPPESLRAVLEKNEPLPSAIGAFPTYWEDLVVGDIYAHEGGRTVSEAEHMQLTTLLRNSHPMHVDEGYCKKSSFAKTRIVFGGLVLAFTLALASRDIAGNGIWELSLDEGAHPSGVLAGDTLYAASKILAKEPFGPHAGLITLRVVGLKNTPARALLEKGADLFSAELGKTEGRIAEKAVEITRTLLIRRRG